MILATQGGALAACTALALALLCAGPSARAAAGPEAEKAPAAHIDHMDLTGTWDRYRAPGFKIDPRFTSSIPVETNPPLKPKYLAEWRARQKAAHEADVRGQPLYGGYAQCLPDGMPAMMMAMFPMQVLQTPGQITVIQEAYRQVRYIYLDQTQVPIADAEPGFWGHSVGHWEGDTLVVDTVGFNDKAWLDLVGHPRTEKAHIIERFTRPELGRINAEITIDDPGAYSRPWAVFESSQLAPDWEIIEYVCNENNRDVNHLVGK